MTSPQDAPERRWESPDSSHPAFPEPVQPQGSADVEAKRVRRDLSAILAQAAPAGPVLGDDERRQLSSAIDQADTGLPERLDWRAVDALVEALAPVVAALLSSAREEGERKGAEDERERIREVVRVVQHQARTNLNDAQAEAAIAATDWVTAACSRADHAATLKPVTS